MAAGWCLDTTATTKEINLQGEQSSALGRFGSSYSCCTRPSLSLYSLSHHLRPSKNPGFSLRAYPQCPTSTAPAGLLLIRHGEQTPRNHRLPMTRQQLDSKIQPPAYTSALEIPPVCNLAQSALSWGNTYFYQIWNKSA